MPHETSHEANVVIEKGNNHALENSIVLVYGLHDVTHQDVQQACDFATETYAKKILNWPNGRLEKPEIFKVESHDGQLRDSNDCFERFVGHCHVPIEVELGLAVESLRLGDVTETDMLDQFTN
ncbi:hypothetical protein FBULB1_4508 [Fusarium bulbicola]|nr:hypothetical protein FBULB1_4508 [Fusarium bulbicola]